MILYKKLKLVLVLSKDLFKKKTIYYTFDFKTTIKQIKKMKS